MLIPPSVLFIIYALITEQSVGDMFVAGIGPGLLLTAMYCLQIFVMARWFPHTVYASRDGAAQSIAQKAEAPIETGELLRKAGPIALLIVLVLGGSTAASSLRSKPGRRRVPRPNLRAGAPNADHGAGFGTCCWKPAALPRHFCS